MARLRNKLSALVLWCVFLVLYLGGAVMLVIGLVLASRMWWAAIHQHASLRVISVKTGEVMVMAVGLLLILVIPLIQHKSVGRSGRVEDGPKVRTRLQGCRGQRRSLDDSLDTASFRLRRARWKRPASREKQSALPVTKNRQGTGDSSTLSFRYSALLILLSEGIGLM